MFKYSTRVIWEIPDGRAHRNMHVSTKNVRSHCGSSDMTRCDQFQGLYVKVKQSHYRPGQPQRVLRKLSFPDFVTTAQDGGRLLALRTSCLYPQEILLVLISVRGWVDPRAIVLSQGLYVNEKFQLHQLESNQRPFEGLYVAYKILKWNC